MTDNIIGFENAPKRQSENISWDNYQTFINIVKANIDALKDPDSAWMILGHSPFIFKGNSQLLEFSCGFIAGWLSTMLVDLEDPVVKNSYIGSELESILCNAMQFMEADLFTPITMHTGDIVNTVILVRTYELWGVTNIFSNGVSVWEALRKTLLENGYTFEQLF